SRRSSHYGRWKHHRRVRCQRRARGAIRRGMCSWRSRQDRRSDEIGHLAPYLSDWRMRAKKTSAPPTLLKQASPAASALANDAPLPPRITLPSDLSTSLRYLGDAELQRLHAAVSTEIDRRGQGASKGEAGKVAATGA